MRGLLGRLGVFRGFLGGESDLEGEVVYCIDS